jgi:hypothetical protein
MTIEQRANDATIQDSIKSFVFLLRFPFGNDFAVPDETPNVQSILVCWTAAPAGVLRRVFFLE